MSGDDEMAKRSRRASARGTAAEAGKTYRILVEVGPHEGVGNLEGVTLDHACMPQPPRDASTGARHLHAYASGKTVEALRKTGRSVDVLADAAAESKQMQKMVGKGDRFKGGRSGPKGVGKLI
jgi:hypothetical protein